MSATVTKFIVGPGQSDNERFGTFLEQLRHNAQLTRVEAANILGFSVEYVRLIELGKRTPASGNVRLICETYGVVYQRMNRNTWDIVGHSVEFTSRILEAPRANPSKPRILNRSEQLGMIVVLLTQADDDTLNKVHQTLLRS